MPPFLFRTLSSRFGVGEAAVLDASGDRVASSVGERQRQRRHHAGRDRRHDAVVTAGGGGLHAIVGTLEVTAAASIISIPIGIMTSIYLVEYGRGKLARAITFLVDVMTGIPSIVAGLFAFALFSLFMGPGVRFGLGGASLRFL